MRVRAALFPIAFVSLLVSSLAVAACGGDSELDDVKAERDALAAELAAVESRYEMSRANQEMIAEIVAEPEAFGDRSEALDKMTALATPEAVMNDTAFGPVLPTTVSHSS